MPGLEDPLVRLFLRLNEEDRQTRAEGLALVMSVFEFLARQGLASRDDLKSYLAKEAEGMVDAPRMARLKQSLFELAKVFEGDEQGVRHPSLRLIKGGLLERQ